LVDTATQSIDDSPVSYLSALIAPDDRIRF
jgi:hypothetical protein